MGLTEFGKDTGKGQGQEAGPTFLKECVWAEADFAGHCTLSILSSLRSSSPSCSSCLGQLPCIFCLGHLPLLGLPTMPVPTTVFVFGYPHHPDSSVIHIVLVIHIVRSFTVVITSA